MPQFSFDMSDTDFYLEHNRKPLQEQYKKEHYHGAWELYFYLGDEMTFFLNDTSYCVHKYDMVFVDRYNYHKTSYKDNKKERVLIMLKKEFFSMFSDLDPIFNYLLTISKARAISFDDDGKILIRDKFIRIAQMYEEGNVKNDKLQIYVTELLATISELLENEKYSVCRALKNKNTIMISQITNYINNNYAEKITLDFLSDKFFIDKFHLCHIFRKEIGITLVEFLNQKRIVEAGILLRTTDKSVYDIAIEVGFHNQNYFGALFRKHTGMSPMQYRKKDI